MRGKKPISLGSWTDQQLSSGQKRQGSRDLGNWAEVPVSTRNPHRKETEKGKEDHQIPNA